MTDRETRKPGFRIRNITLDKLHFEINHNYQPSEGNFPAPEVVANLKYTDILDQQFFITLELGFEFPKDKKPFDLEVAMTGVFAVDEGLDPEFLKKIQQINGPAILYPYLRAVVSDVTNKSGYPVLNLPPINIHLLHRETEKTE